MQDNSSLNIFSSEEVFSNRIIQIETKMNSRTKRSFWCCDECNCTFDHGEFRYNCTICSNYDLCKACITTMNPTHPHPLDRELAFGEGERIICEGKSMAATIHTALKMYHDRHCLGVRDTDKHNPELYLNSYSWLTYKTVDDRVRKFGHGLRSLIKPREYLGICAANRPEWVITDLTCMLNSIISVPMYCLLNDCDTAFIINNTKISVVVCDKEMLPKFLRLHSECPSLCQLICMDQVPGTTANTGTHTFSGKSPNRFSSSSGFSLSESNQNNSVIKEENNFPIHYMGDLEQICSDQCDDYIITKPTDCLTIIYTSGSSDFPKGVMISDSAFRAIFPEDPSPSTSELVTISYQPLAWYGGRNSLFSTLLCGGRSGFSTGNISELMEELALIRPTIFAAPPSIWNHVYSEFKTTLSLAITDDSVQNFQQEENLLHQFSKLIPTKCNTIVIVGALIGSAVLNFIKRCFRHCQIMDAYGITECGGVSFDNQVYPNVAYRLESVPEMGFTINDKPFSRGELLVKTAQIFSGYVNNPVETRAALTDDGFFRTGDIVEFHEIPNKPPEICVIDRKKNFFKLSHGQFVSPEHLQSVFIRSPFIEQIYIHGNLYDDFVTAVVVPNREHAQAFAFENNLKHFESDPKLYNTIMHELHSIGTKASLRPHEIPSRIIIDFELFTVENGLLTSSMKLCRPKLAAHYANQLKNINSIEQRLKTMIETVTGQPLNDNDGTGFLATGGQSLTALRLSRLIQKHLGATIPISVFFEPETNLKRLTILAQNPSLTQDSSLVARLIHDAELELNVRIGKPKNIGCTPLAVFVTGATGFVGAFLLVELLKQYPINCKFVCLVRCETSVNPLDRLQKNMSFLHLWQDNFRERIVALCGDLSQSRFGLDDETYVALANKIDIIFHCGATVNFVLPYSQLYGSNVFGTQEIIRFATHAATCIPIQYISTISVLPPSVTDEVRIDETTPHDLINGYGQSKWVAEKLMAKVNRLGLPVVIYRLGSMCGDTQSGACNPLDLNTILFVNILKIGCYPVEALNTKLNTLPIDFAIKSIVYLTLFKPDVYGHVYHIIHSDGGMIFQNIVTSAISCGIKMEAVSSEQWQTRVMQDTTLKHPLESISAFLLEKIFAERSTLSSKQFYSVISGMKIPVMDHKYVRKWLTFILQNIVK